MLEDIKSKNINVIVAFKLDRLTRSVKDLIYLIDLIWVITQTIQIAAHC